MLATEPAGRRQLPEHSAGYDYARPEDALMCHQPDVEVLHAGE